VRTRRKVGVAYKATSSKDNANYSRGFDPEERKYEYDSHYDKINNQNSHRMQLSDISTSDLEALRRRIETLEVQNRDKDSTIRKLKAENGQLRAQRNVMQSKLKFHENEETKETRSSKPRTHPRPPMRSEWDSLSKKLSGKPTRWRIV